MLNPVYGYQAVNVESQKRFDHSLLCWMKRIIKVRKANPVLGRGSIEFLYPANHRILAYVRQLEKESILVVNNLSSTAQAVELDLRSFKGNILIEMFGRNIFPRWRFALSPHLGSVPVLLVSSAQDLRINGGRDLAEESILTDEFLRQLIDVGEADVLVGVPTYNNAATVGQVVQTIRAGLLKYFPRERAVIVNADGGSRDQTCELVRELPSTTCSTRPT